MKFDEKHLNIENKELFDLIRSNKRFFSLELIDKVLNGRVNLNNSDKIMILNEKTKILLQLKLTKNAVESAKLALDIAKTTPNDWKSIGSAQYHLGRVLIDLKKINDAKILLNQSLEIFRKNNYSDGLANVYYHLGYLYNTLGEVDLAKNFLKSSISLLNKQKLPILTSTVFLEFGVLLSGIGDYKKAEKYYKKSLEIRKKHNDSLLIADSLNNLGNLYARLGDLKLSEEYHLQALNLRESLEIQNEINQSRINLGNIYGMKGELNKSASYFKKCLSFYHENNNVRVLAALYNNLGIISFKLSNFEQSIIYHKQSLKYRKELGIPELIGTALTNIGVVYRNIGNLNLAEKYYKESLNIQEKIGNPKDIALLLSNLARIYTLRGQLDLSEEYHRRCLKLREEIGNPLDLASSYANLGSICLQKGSDEQAEQFFLKSLKNYQNIQDIVLVEYFLFKTYLFRNMLKEAETKVENLFQYYKNSNLIDVFFHYQLSLSWLNFKKFNFNSALKAIIIVYEKAKEINAFDFELSSLNLLININLQIYSLNFNEKHLSNLMFWLEGIEYISENKQLQGSYIEVVITKGKVKALLSDLDGAKNDFNSALLLAVECNNIPLIEIINHELRQLDHEISQIQNEMSRLQKINQISPFAVKYVKVNEFLSYLNEIDIKSLQPRI